MKSKETKQNKCPDSCFPEVPSGSTRVKWCDKHTQPIQTNSDSSLDREEQYKQIDNQSQKDCKPDCKPTLSDCCGDEIVKDMHLGTVLYSFCYTCREKIPQKKCNCTGNACCGICRPDIQGSTGGSGYSKKEKECDHKYNKKSGCGGCSGKSNECRHRVTIHDKCAECGKDFSPPKEDWMEEFDKKFYKVKKRDPEWKSVNGKTSYHLLRNEWNGKGWDLISARESIKLFIQSQIEAERGKAFKEGYKKGNHEALNYCEEIMIPAEKLKFREQGRKEGMKEHHKKCIVGCPYYQSGHSINADGSCNMGCC